MARKLSGASLEPATSDDEAEAPEWSEIEEESDIAEDGDEEENLFTWATTIDDSEFQSLPETAMHLEANEVNANASLDNPVSFSI